MWNIEDGMGKEVGGCSGWGTHVNPWLIHVNVWQKTLQYCKVISLQLIKINEKKVIPSDIQIFFEFILPVSSQNTILKHLL